MSEIVIQSRTVEANLGGLRHPPSSSPPERGPGRSDLTPPRDRSGTSARASSLEPLALEWHCGVKIDGTFDQAQAVGDPGLVASLVANLLDNAIRNNHADGTVAISTAATADGARLTISNTGAIVPLLDVDRLFQPFQRLDDQRVGTAADGHGLGLAIVKAIATAPDAHLSARPGPRGGLEIQVTFGPHA